MNGNAVFSQRASTQSSPVAAMLSNNYKATRMKVLVAKVGGIPATAAECHRETCPACVKRLLRRKCNKACVLHRAARTTARWAGAL